MLLYRVLICRTCYCVLYTTTDNTTHWNIHSTAHNTTTRVLCGVWCLCCDWTGENDPLGDRFIHDRDLDWLHQSDGEVLIAAFWLLFFLASCSRRWVTSDLSMCVLSCHCRGNAAFPRGRLWTWACCQHEEENFLPFQTLIRKTWGHFLFTSVFFSCLWDIKPTNNFVSFALWSQVCQQWFGELRTPTHLWLEITVKKT